MITDDDLAILLLCSSLGIESKGDILPISNTAYSCIARILYYSDNRPSDLLSMSKGNFDKILENPTSRQILKESRTRNLAERVFPLLSRYDNLSNELNELASKGISVLTRASANYPSIFKDKLRNSRPPVLYYAGNLNLLNKKTCAVVGSRDIDKDKTAETFTRNFVKKAIADNYTISSGGARGIDVLAWEETIQSSGKSVISVSDNLLKKTLSPTVSKKIDAGDTLFLSMVHPKAKFESFNAMARNKLIYSASEFAMVVTCDYSTRRNPQTGQEDISMTKGGTWVGANECAAKGYSNLLIRTVGRNTPRGNMRLIDTCPCIEIEERTILDSDDSLTTIIGQSKKYPAGNDVQEKLF